jgi:NADH-quinone oxidoreductase subunit L
MVAGLGMGEEGFSAGFFHLFTHAFFKALLFLGAGSVIHAVHSNNMSEMGGLKKPMPVTYWTMLIGSLALAGFPAIGGFWSKDELLLVAQDTGTTWLLVVMLITAGITAFYTTRMVLLTFFGNYEGHAQPHESPRAMTAPLVLLATATVGVGFLGAPQLGAVFGDWVHFGEHHASEFNYPLAGIGTVIALLGIAAGAAVYRTRRATDPMERALGPVWGVLQHRYYIDDLYMATVVRPVRDRLSAAVYWTNQNILDGIVNGMALLARGFSGMVMWIDRTLIDGAVNAAANITGESGGLLKYLQSGNVQWYAVGVVAGVIVLTAFFIRV